MKILSKKKKRGMFSIYAFCRIVDDIADDISYKSRKNYTLNHLVERIKIYNEEQFNYEIIQISLRDNG